MKRIAFDIGNVICHVDLKKFTRKIVSLGIFPDSLTAWDFLTSIQASQDLGLNNIRSDFFKLKCYPDILDYVVTAWYEVVTPSAPMLDFINELLNDRYQIALLSNIGFDHAKTLRYTCGSVFDRCIQHFSCEVGARKPSLLYYQSFILKHPDWFDNSIFFDDRPENIKASFPYMNGNLFNLDDYENDEKAVDAIRQKIDDISKDHNKNLRMFGKK